MRKRRGRQFDPALADLFIDEAEELVAGIDAASSCWEDVIDAEPSLQRFVGGDDLDAALEAMADLVDMSNHIEHIYTKIDDSSRPSATHFAMLHGLVGSFEAGS